MIKFLLIVGAIILLGAGCVFSEPIEINRESFNNSNFIKINEEQDSPILETSEDKISNTPEIIIPINQEKIYGGTPKDESLSTKCANNLILFENRCITLDEDCQLYYGENSYSLKYENDHNSCVCKDGYVSSGQTCILRSVQETPTSTPTPTQSLTDIYRSAVREVLDEEQKQYDIVLEQRNRFIEARFNGKTIFSEEELSHLTAQQRSIILSGNLNLIGDELSVITAKLDSINSEISFYRGMLYPDAMSEAEMENQLEDIEQRLTELENLNNL